jgi:hypothetical protein
MTTEEALVSVIKALLKANNKLTMELIARDTKDSCACALPQVSTGVETSPVVVQQKKYIGEDEEDANFLFNTGQISKPELEELLKEAGFFNSEITVPQP